MTTKLKPVLRPGQQEQESAMEYLRRVVSNLNSEYESYMDDLPCVDAVLEFFELWHAYGTDLMVGVIECIESGESPKPLKKFIKKWQLDWEVPTAVRDED